MSTRIRVAIAGAAVLLWLAPLPHTGVERWYARGFYPPWQRMTTMVSNFVPFALFDVIVVGLSAWLLYALVRARRARSWSAAGSGLLMVAGIAALWFQVGWGLNYRRTPVGEQLRLPAEARAGELARFASRAADEARTLADRLDRRSPPTRSSAVSDLSPGFTRAQQILGLGGTARPGRPKRSLLDPYFRWAAIDGVTNPFVPEVIVVSNLTPAEVHSTIAHEWGHLAGYASEDEASFAGWLMCIESEGAPRYSGWLFALMKSLGAGTRAERSEWLRRAGPVVLADLREIQKRFEQTSPAVRNAASAAYDQFLRANRVEEGIRSYDEVLRLMLAYQRR